MIVTNFTPVQSPYARLVLPPNPNYVLGTIPKL